MHGLFTMNTPESTEILNLECNFSTTAIRMYALDRDERYYIFPFCLTILNINTWWSVLNNNKELRILVFVPNLSSLVYIKCLFDIWTMFTTIQYIYHAWNKQTIGDGKIIVTENKILSAIHIVPGNRGHILLRR